VWEGLEENSEMNLLDSLFLIAGISAKDLGFEKDLSRETSLKPPQVLKFLKDPLYMKKFGDSIVEVFRNFDREKLMGLIWWEKFYPIKVSDRVSYRDSTVGHIVDILVCMQYFLDRAFKGLDPKITEKITYVWDTVDRKDTLSKEDYLYLAKNVPWNLLANSFYCLLKLDTSKLKPIPDTGIYIYNTAYGKIALGGKGNNVYRGDFVAIVDFGGDDEYYVEKTAVIVDFSGNDVYYGKVGGGYLGSSAIYDFSGNDTYYCSDYSCGGGLLGFGMIFDAEGDDFYSGGIHSLGAGTFGGGFLIDLKGKDIYKGVLYSQGFGGPYGVGFLYDGEGDDLYTLGYGPIHEPLYKTQRQGLGQGFGFGRREDLGGGFGILMDFSGNDVYNAGTYAQGSSYWYSFGFLYDRTGDDRYLCTQYCQGAVIHISTAYLRDDGGNDVYFSFAGPSLGAGHDLAVGILYEGDGNDIYISHSGAGMGWTNSVGIFLDVKGRDSYYFQSCENSHGGVNFEREFGGIGIFIDGEGDDEYKCKIDKGFSVKGKWGFILER
jgi:hypothetical protein